METKEFLDIIEPMLKTMMKQNIEFENKFGEKAFQMGPIDINKILIFEKNHGINIPKYYKEFLSKYNPGGIEILLGLEEIESIIKNLPEMKNLLNEGFLPITSDNAGNFFCIDTQNPKDDILFFADHEEEFEIQTVGNVSKFFRKTVKYRNR